MGGRRRRDAQKLAETYFKQGYVNALWAHHPPEVKAAIREFGWRPQIKNCFMNSQQFFLDCWRRKPELFERLEYHEGYVVTILPLEHAWLKLDGEVLDLTLDPGIGREYLRSHTYGSEEVLKHVVKTGTWGPVSGYELGKLSPFYEAHMELLKREKEMRREEE